MENKNGYFRFPSNKGCLPLSFIFGISLLVIAIPLLGFNIRDMRSLYNRNKVRIEVFSTLAVTFSL